MDWFKRKKQPKKPSQHLGHNVWKCLTCDHIDCWQHYSEWVCYQDPGRHPHFFPPNYRSELGYPATIIQCKECKDKCETPYLWLSRWFMYDITYKAALNMACVDCKAAYRPFNTECPCGTFAFIEDAISKVEEFARQCMVTYEQNQKHGVKV
jgi:ferredoxin